MYYTSAGKCIICSSALINIGVKCQYPTKKEINEQKSIQINTTFSCISNFIVLNGPSLTLLVLLIYWKLNITGNNGVKFLLVQEITYYLRRGNGIVVGNILVSYVFDHRFKSLPLNVVGKQAVGLPVPHCYQWKILIN